MVLSDDLYSTKNCFHDPKGLCHEPILQLKNFLNAESFVISTILVYLLIHFIALSHFFAFVTENSREQFYIRMTAACNFCKYIYTEGVLSCLE